MIEKLKIRAMYFSGTGTTEKTVKSIAQNIYEYLSDPKRWDDEDKPHIEEDMKAARDAVIREEDIDFTPLDARNRQYSFTLEDIVVFGVPTIAGRVPNVLLPFLETIEGNGAIAIPVVLYGNRNYDDSLIEIRNILDKCGFHTVAAAAFIGEHSFSRKLAAGRPDDEDMKVADGFAMKTVFVIAAILSTVAKMRDALEDNTQIKDLASEELLLGELLDRMGPVSVKGQMPPRPYYKPRDRKGNHINILKVKPKLNRELCDSCGICVDACPMGSIKPEAPGVVDGICIKCCGCEKKCPKGALYFDDPGYLYHKEELELGYAERKEPELFFLNTSGNK